MDRDRGPSVIGSRSPLPNIGKMRWRAASAGVCGNKRLSFRAESLPNARKQRLYQASFDRLTTPTGQSQAPYFLVWFFNALQDELRAVDRDLGTQRLERNALRLTIPLALIVAASAFGYFILIMFLFLVVSIEASVRRLAGLATQQPSIASVCWTNLSRLSQFPCVSKRVEKTRYDQSIRSLESRNGRVADAVGSTNIGQRLARLAPSNRFLGLK